MNRSAISFLVALGLCVSIAAILPTRKDSVIEGDLNNVTAIHIAKMIRQCGHHGDDHSQISLNGDIEGIKTLDECRQWWKFESTFQ